LIDFDLASTYTQERPDFTHHQQIAGTLAYLAPEQTGRSGRRVDQRSDLYALGITLYELATGRLPFEQRDALQLIHDHLVRTPRTPAGINKALPPALSAMIMRLLEKEPDRRYQGADGLAYDLIRLKDALTHATDASFPLAEHDFPSLLLAPSRLIGRETERATLREAFDNAMHSSQRAAFVTGAPGVGKTVLVDSLRAVATEHRGWFVAGKFDQVQQGAAGIRQALGALGRLLLAESEEDLAAHRVRIARALGTRASHLTDLIPEFAIVLGPSTHEDPSEPLDADAQIRQAMLDLFRAVASPVRPLVVFLDDLQWAGGNTLGLIDAVVGDEELRGLLIVGSYRNSEVTHDHPLARTLARWASLGTPPVQLHLVNLDPAGLRLLLTEVLRLPSASSARLAGTIGARTDGNPFDTLELINALRRDGILVPGPSGWSWDDAPIRRYVGANTVIDLIAVRIDRLARDEREMLRVIACLGGDVEVGLLAIALKADSAAILDRLEAPLEDGLLLVDREGAVRFSHDRVQAAAYESMGDSERAVLHLDIGRRLAAADRFGSAAAEQYAFAVNRVSDPGEARVVVGLFARAAAVARLSTSYADVERFLAAAILLLEKIATTHDRAFMNQLRGERHTALYRLARYAEGDAVYRAIEQNDPNLLALAAAACVQICSLANRGLQAEALAIARDLLPRLGLRFPPAGQMAVNVERGLDTLQTWIDAGMPSNVPAKSVADPTLLLVARLMTFAMPSAFFSDPIVSHWLGLQRLRLWLENGCPSTLTSGIVGNAIALIGLRADFRRAYRLARYARAAIAQVVEPDASRTRHIFALVASHWGEPLDATLAYAERARVGLVAAGDVQFACYT
jgi:predicted ATPase